MGNKLTNIIRQPIGSIIFILLLINVILIVYIIKKPKTDLDRRNIIFDPDQLKDTAEADYYNAACPDFELIDNNGEKNLLSALIGNEIIIRFTRFHPQDMPYLIYLDQLSQKYKNKGLRLIIINYLGMKPPASIILSCPVIEDDGYIASLFQARLDDTLIIGRDFKIKLKANDLSNDIIYEQTMKYLFDEIPPTYISDSEFTALLKKIAYRDIANDRQRKLAEIIEDGAAIINIFISPCIECPENERIRLLKEVASKNGNSKIVFLFGLGNPVDLIREFVEKKQLYRNTIIGSIEKSTGISEQEYYRMIRPDINPRLLIFNRGKMIFLEKENNEKEVLDILKNYLRECQK